MSVAIRNTPSLLGAVMATLDEVADRTILHAPKKNGTLGKTSGVPVCSSHRGKYRAKPSKRTWIPKLDGKLRPLGIASLEDKIVQQAVRVVLECIYEEDFLGFIYGLRPGRGCHQALDALSVGISTRRVNWILVADIRGFFDNINHEWLLKFLEHRIADRRLLRLLKKWLRAGVSEDGEWSPSTVGMPQGGVGELATNDLAHLHAFLLIALPDFPAFEADIYLVDSQECVTRLGL